MPRTPLLALAAAVTLIAAVVSITSPESVDPSAEAPTTPPLPDTPLSTAHVLAGAVEASAPTDFEAEPTVQAISRTISTTTTSTTTTTTVAEVETVAEEEDTRPETEKPSNPTTTSTTAAPTTTTTKAPEEPPAEGSFDHAAESEFAGLIDSTRSSNGKGSLIRDGSLDARARDWAKYMAESGSLAHSNLGSLVPPWTAVAENLGQGGSVSQVFDLLAGSSGHLSNMLGDFTHVGIGVWRDSNGVLWTTHLFAR